MQWVRRALTVPAADSPYLLNDSAGSGRFSLSLSEQAPGQAEDVAEAPAAGTPISAGPTSASSTAATTDQRGGKSGKGEPAGPGAHSAGAAPAASSRPAKEQPVERQDVDIVFGHGGFRGLRLWMVLRMVRRAGRHPRFVRQGLMRARQQWYSSWVRGPHAAAAAHGARLGG